MEDYACLHEIAAKAKKIYYISQSLYFYRMRNDSLTAKSNLELSYNCYLIAKGRDDFLKKHGFIHGDAGSLTFAIGLCAEYHQSDEPARAAFKEKYEICRNAVNQNIAAALRNKDFNIKRKKYFLLEYFNLLGPYVRTQEFIKNLFRGRQRPKISA